MGEVFTPYQLPARTAEPRALLLALQKIRGLEELILGWVMHNRSLSLTPLAVKQGVVANQGAHGPRGPIAALDVHFSKGTRTVGGGVMNLDFVLPFVPSFSSVGDALSSTGTPTEQWFDQRNADLGIELDAEYDLNRCPPRSLSQLIFGYLLNQEAICTIRGTGTAKSPQICLELVYLSPRTQENSSKEQERVGWKEVCLVNRIALENFVPHVYWV